MRSDKSITVNYANLAPAFIKFQEQYKNLCQNITVASRHKTLQSFKKANSFFFEYKTYVQNKQLNEYMVSYFDKLKNELLNDTEFVKLCNTYNKNINEGIRFNQKYYYYLIQILKIVGSFGDELSKTFMPNKTDREKQIKYWNNNAFFEQFTIYKSKVADELSDFDIRRFKKSFTFFLGFYYAYYLFVDEQSRKLCENIFSNVLNIVLNEDNLKLIVSDYNQLVQSKKDELKTLDLLIHNALNNVFARINYSYSEYNVMPRINKKINIDKTSI